MMKLLEKARDTKRIVSRLSESEKNQGLLAMAQSLERYAPDILAANALDMEEANGRISPVMLDRLKLTEDRIRAVFGIVMFQCDPLSLDRAYLT